MGLEKFEIYRNMRKQAEIMGLSISYFALMMTSVIGSLMVIIFSFGFMVILSVLLFNIMLYIALIYLTKNPSHFQFRKVFPKTISNKKACLALTERFDPCLGNIGGNSPTNSASISRSAVQKFIKQTLKLES